MITRQDAEKIASTELFSISKELGIPLAFELDNSLDMKSAWAFFYNSVSFLRNHEFSDRLVGNTPIIVMKETGNIVECNYPFTVGNLLLEFD